MAATKLKRMSSGNTEMTYNRIIERKEKVTQTASENFAHPRTDQRPCRPELSLSLCQGRLSQCAMKTGPTLLLHEIPLADISRFGKYCEWDLNAVRRRRPYIPKKSNSDQKILVAFASVVTYATKFIGDNLRTNIGHAGVGHRLRTQDSTPINISLDTCTNLEEHLKSVIEGGLLEGHDDTCAALGEIWNAVADLNVGLWTANGPHQFLSSVETGSLL